MGKQNSPLLGKAIYVLIMIAFGFGIYAATKSIDYTWRWERVPEYIINTNPEKITSDIDGTVVIKTAADGSEQYIVESDDGEDPFVIGKHDQLLVDEGDFISVGDSLAEVNGWRLGPIAWGLIMTLKISVVALFFAMIIGLFAGLARISSNNTLRYLAITYIEVIRGTPLLVQLFIFYFFIGTVLELDRFTAGAAALAVFTGAYIAEIVRSGIQSIHPGQMEAARSLGMGYTGAMIDVILPQAFKRTLPPMAGQFINLIKDSSLVSVISITDLSKAGREIVSSTFAPFEVWFTVALLYLLLTGSLSWAIQYLEKRLAVSD